MIIQLPQDFKALKGLASDVRLKILEILRKGDRNVNEINAGDGSAPVDHRHEYHAP